jgi:hypothetical protein
MTSFFHDRGYPDEVTSSAVRRISTLDRDSALEPTDKSPNDQERIPLVLNFHPTNMSIRHIINKNYDILRQHSTTKHIFTEPPLSAWRREKNISNRLVRAADPKPNTPGMTPCNRPRCKTCKYVLNTTQIMGLNGRQHHITSSFTCTSKNVIYALICKVCGMLYIGETKTPLAVRFSDHIRSIRNNISYKPVAAHFNQSNHTVDDVQITAILSTSGNPDHIRHIAEQRLIASLNTIKPAGINVKFDVFKCNWLI